MAGVAPPCEPEYRPLPGIRWQERDVGPKCEDPGCRCARSERFEVASDVARYRGGLIPWTDDIEVMILTNDETVLRRVFKVSGKPDRCVSSVHELVFQIRSDSTTFS